MHRPSAHRTPSFAAILDQETSDVGSGLILRLFAGLATRCPRWVVPSTGTSAGDLREKMTMIAELLLHSQEDAPEDDNNMEVWSFDTLISHPAFGELQLHQMVEILDKLPPPGPDEDGPLLSGTARLDEIFKVKSEPPEYTGAFKGEFSKHGTACVRSMLGQLSLDAAAEGDCTFVQPHRLPLKLTQHFHHGCGHPAPPVQLAHFILDPDMAAPGVHGMTRAADFTLRIKVMPDATMADEPSDAPSEEKSGTVVDIKDMGLFLHNRCNPSFFIEKGGSVGGAEGGVEGGDSAAESSVPVPASRLQVYAQMRVAREARRREMLEAWARARGTECTTLAELLTYYDGFLADYEKAALVCEKSTESAASAGGVAARGAPPLKAFAGLRASIIDQSIAPYVWRPGVLAGLLAADGTPAGASPLPLSPALLRRILDARPPPSADEDEKPKGADKEKGSTSADELTERLPCRESNRRRLPHRLPGRADKSHVYTEGKDVYDVLLQKSDLGADEKSYCVIQLLEAEGAPQQWYVVRQFKASLEDKPTNNTMLQTKYKHSAKKDFCEMFHELTSNEWSSREQFQPAVGKYSLVTRTHERALSPTATTETQEAASDDDDATAATGKPPASLPQLCRAAKEESALLDALRPWCASHSLDDLLHVLPALRLELVPLAELRRHVHDADGCLRASHDPRSPLRAQLADALLPGCTALRVASLDDDTPEELTCCISMELMTDPVVAMDGKSYERANINKYWERQEGRPISPITREQLSSAELYPNHNLRMVCAEFAAKHARVRMSTNDPAELVMAAILAPPTTTALDDGGAEASHRLADVYARAAGKRARKLADGADKHRADDERKRQCIAQ